MKLYYGADRIVEKPLFNYGNSTNDFGLGFYLTPDYEMAKLWASKFPNGGYVITYDLDLKGLNVAKLDSASENDTLKWISVLIRHRFDRDLFNRYKATIEWLNRTYFFDELNYDVIIGYRADDSYFQYSRDFVANELSLELLTRAMKLGKLGIQIVLKSKKSFERIRILNFEKIDHSDEYEQFRLETLNEYRSLLKEERIDNTYIRDIMRRSNK